MDGMAILRMFGQSLLLAVPAAAVFSALFCACRRFARGRIEAVPEPLRRWLVRCVGQPGAPFPVRRWLVCTLLVGWGAAALGVTLVFRLSGAQAVSRAGANLTLLRSYVCAWNEGSALGLWLNFLNVLLFVPLGLLLSLGEKRGVGVRAAGLVSLAASGLIEILQLITRRGFFDVDDLLHNTLGGVLGYCAALFVLHWAREKRPDKRLFLRLAAALLLLAAAPLCGLAAYRLQRWGAVSEAPEKSCASVRPKQTRTAQPAPPLPPLLLRHACPAAYVARALDAPKALVRGQTRLWFDVHLQVPTVLQLPQLRNGCEAASLAALLQARGVAADKMELAYTYIPRVDFTETPYGLLGADPERAYPGDPAEPRGYYCYAAPLAQGANRFLRQKGLALHAKNITGVSDEELLQTLRSGRPVAVWVTLDLDAPYTGDFAWILPDLETVYAPYRNVHCVVLMGWGCDTCEVMDPLQGVRTVDREAFLQSFAQMGRRALIIP